MKTRAALVVSCNGSLEEHFDRVPLQVDLFKPSCGPKFGLAALRLQEQGLGLTAIGKKLGISKCQTNRAVQYGRGLRAAGLSDPFVEITEPPAAASRWRNHGETERKPNRTPTNTPENPELANRWITSFARDAGRRRLMNGIRSFAGEVPGLAAREDGEIVDKWP